LYGNQYGKREKAEKSGKYFLRAGKSGKIKSVILSPKPALRLDKMRFGTYIISLNGQFFRGVSPQCFNREEAGYPGYP